MRGLSHLEDVAHKGTVSPADTAQEPIVVYLGGISGIMKEWFSILPLPLEIQSGNGSGFIAMMVQDWSKEEEIWWIFHIP